MAEIQLEFKRDSSFFFESNAPFNVDVAHIFPRDAGLI